MKSGLEGVDTNEEKEAQVLLQDASNFEHTGIHTYHMSMDLQDVDDKDTGTTKG